MHCPAKMSNPQLSGGYDPQAGSYTETDWECMGNTCALWNAHFGMCSHAVDAYLKADMEWRAESVAERKDRV